MLMTEQLELKPVYEAATIAKWKELRPDEETVVLSRLREDEKLLMLVQTAFEAGRDWQADHPGASTEFPDYASREVRRLSYSPQCGGCV